MRKIILTSLVLFTTISFSQDLSKADYRRIIKETLNSHYLDDSEKKFTAYDVINNLNFELEFNINITSNQIKEVEDTGILVERSKAFAYTLMSEISKSNLMKQIDEDANYKRIILYFKLRTKDYEYVKHNFKIDVKALRRLSSNMNKSGFYRILKEV